MLFSLFVLSCGQDDPNINIPTPPVKTEDPTPALDNVRENINEASEKNREIKSEVDKATKNILKQKASIEEALAQAERIKEKALAKQALTEIEALNLQNILEKIQDENIVLKTDNENLNEKVEELTLILEKTKQSEKETREKLSKSQDELKEYRIKFEDIVKDLKSSEESRNQLQKDKEKLTKQVADARVYKKIIWYIGIGYLVLIIIKNILAYAFPGMSILKRF